MSTDEPVVFNKTKPFYSHGHYNNPWSTWTGLPSVIDFLRWKFMSKEEDSPKVIPYNYTFAYINVS